MAGWVELREPSRVVIMHERFNLCTLSSLLRLNSGSGFTGSGLTEADERDDDRRCDRR